MTDARPDNYSSNQLIAHWLVVLLVLMQYLQNDAMQRAFGNALETGAFPLEGGAWMHGISGATILALMLWRLVMRRTHGTPPPPEAEPDRLRRISRGTHHAFYAVLMTMPVLGLLAVLTLWSFFAFLHSVLSWVLLLLIVAHLGGAAWHMVRGDSAAWQRMLRQEPPGDV